MSQHMKFNSRSASVIAALLVILLLFFANAVVHKWVPVRQDITEEKLYSVSEGTEKILSNITEPITLEFYRTRDDDLVTPDMKLYSSRVYDLLKEYVSIRPSIINLKTIDPAHLSEEEQDALRQGIQGIPSAQKGMNYYCGMVIHGAADSEVIPFFDPRRERFLEYDITRAIYQVSLPGKKVVGIISNPQVFGVEPPPSFMPNMQQQQGQPPWLFLSELEKIYEVRDIKPGNPIGADVNLLIVIQPKNLVDKALYQIDQFVMSGRNAIFLTDPLFVDEESNRQNQFAPPELDRSLERLFDAWGVDMKYDQLVTDTLLATEIRTAQGAFSHPAWLSLQYDDNFNREVPASAHLGRMLFIYAYSMELNGKVEGVSMTPLLMTSNSAVNRKKSEIMYAAPDELMKENLIEGDILNLAAIYEGNFKSAFSEKLGDDTAPFMPETAEGTIAVIGDVDFVHDNYAFVQGNLFGQRIAQPRNDNAYFLYNLVEMLMGNRDLISLRSRGQFVRPFLRVREIEVAAQRRWQSKITELQAEIEDIKSKIEDKVNQVQPGQRLILSEEEQKELNKFRARQAETEKKLREVEKTMLSDIDALGNFLKLVNIFAVPLVLAFFAIIGAVIRSGRTRA